ELRSAGSERADDRAREKRDDHHAAGDALDRALDGQLNHDGLPAGLAALQLVKCILRPPRTPDNPRRLSFSSGAARFGALEQPDSEGHEQDDDTERDAAAPSGVRIGVSGRADPGRAAKIV